MNPLPALMLAVFALAPPAQAPPYVTVLEGATASVPSPAAEPDKWLLAFVDVKTTGLVPGYHEMIDVGIVMTDLEGKAIDYLLLRIQPKHPERTSPGARAVNAFDPERWEKLGALAPEAAVDRIVSFHRAVARDRHVLMVAFNSQFDAAFLDQLFRGANRSWREIYHYFVLDLPSMTRRQRRAARNPPRSD